MNEDDRRMIEFQIPLAEVSEASAKEKKHPRRYVELIHQWPARRPRSASRVAIAAALLKVPKTPKEIEKRLALLKQLAPYECPRSALDEARRLIKEEHGGRAPKVLDMFAGGGAIPLEAANLGCEAYAVELNPVAHIIELATCVYPQKYGQKLAELVEKWGKRVLAQVKDEIADLYPPIRLKRKEAKQLTFASGSEGEDGVLFEPIAYLWTRTVPCVDRECGATVPLVRQTWLCRKDNRAIALTLVPDRQTKQVRFHIVSATSPETLGFDPADLSDRGEAECQFCGAAIDANKVKELGKRGKIQAQLMAVAGTIEGERGRAYLPAEAVEMPSEEIVRERLLKFGDEWPGPAKLALAPNDAGGSCALYGLDEFWKLFTERQAVALLTFSRVIANAHATIRDDVRDDDLARVVTTYLALALDKVADHGCSLAGWHPNDQKMVHALHRTAIPILWDFAEVNPMSSSGGAFPLTVKAQVDSIVGLAGVPSPAASCIRGSAATLSHADGTFDAVVTDPPYYDNVSYADLSDFFFVWLKRTLGSAYPEHLGGDHAPRKTEATVTPSRHGGDVAAARAHYETTMTSALREAGRVLRSGGPMVVVYAHKTVAGWATLVDSLRGATCEVCEAWPLRTESETRLRARDSAALATSIFLAARKRSDDIPCDDYDDVVVPEVVRVIEERVRTLWKVGLTGADLVIAVIGAALGPFTRYARVRRSNGVEVATVGFLEEAQRLAIEAILRHVLVDAGAKDVSVGSIDPVSRLYVVARLQFGDAAAHYDAFKNLAIGTLPAGTELEGIKGALMQGRKALLAKKGSKVQVLGYEDRGKESGLGEPKDGVMPPLIDVLHRLLWLQNHKPSAVEKFIRNCQADMGAVRLLAQALGGRPLKAEPRAGAKVDGRTAEQRAIDTFLASYRDPSVVSTGQMDLFEGTTK